MKGGALTPEEEKKCRSARGIFALMKEADPNFRKTFLFTKAYLSAMSFPGTVTIMNTGFLMDKWHELSNYCHKVLRPIESFESPNREFQKKGFKMIRDVLNYYYDVQGTQAGYVMPNSIKGDLRSVYNEFINNQIDERQLKIRLNLMLPILNARKPLTIKHIKRIR